MSRIAFGSFWSPNFLDAHQVIAGVPTAADVAAPLVSAQILFHVYLPTGPAPAAGFPVVIVGHGVGGERFSATANIAAAMAAKGVAVIGVNAVGHGYGPQTKLALTDKSGATVEIAAPGRAVDLNHDGAYGAAEGCALTAPPYAFGYRDCSRQTALDIMQLVRAIRAGMDLDGDGSLDLDPERIYYAGFSQGAMFGAVLMAVEPHIEAATLTSGAGSIPDTWRWVREGPSWAGAVAAMSLRKPTLFNVGTQNFDYDWPLRDKPVHIISVPGAIALQEYLERAAWVMMPGDALGYAPHLQASPLPGVPAKRVLFQFGIGDTTLPNPCESNLVRAAKMRETTSVYRHDLARATVFGADLPRNPHGLFASATTASGMVIARAAQRQMAEFLASGLAFVPDVNAVVVPYFGISLFGIPEALPEELNYLP